MNRKESLFDSMGGPEKGRLVLDIVFEEIVQTPPTPPPSSPPTHILLMTKIAKQTMEQLRNIMTENDILPGGTA